MELRTPQEIINNLTEKRQILLNKTIETVARQLEASFNGAPLEIYIEEPSSLMQAIEIPLKKKLASKGWYVDIGKCTSNRDGYVTTLIVSAINQASVTNSNTNFQPDKFKQHFEDEQHFEQQWER